MKNWTAAFLLVWCRMLECPTQSGAVSAESGGIKSAYSFWDQQPWDLKVPPSENYATSAGRLPTYGVPHGSSSADSFPSYYERAMQVWINVARAEPRKFAESFIVPRSADNTTRSVFSSGAYAPQPPLAWHVDLNRAARGHCLDRAVNCITVAAKPHQDCNGTSLASRFNKFHDGGRAEVFWNMYPASWVVGHQDALGHEATMRFWPVFAVAGWLCGGVMNPYTGRFGECRSDHSNDAARAVIMAPQAREVGCGNVFKSIVYKGRTEQTYIPVATCDFAGTRQYTVAVVSGAHVWTHATEAYRYLANFHLPAGVFRSAFVVVDGVPQALSLFAGRPTSGTYGTGEQRWDASLQRCSTYYFVFAYRDQYSEERVERYPAHGSFWTFGDGYCNEDYTEHEVPVAHASAEFLAIVEAQKAKALSDSGEWHGLAKRIEPEPKCLNCYDYMFQDLTNCGPFQSSPAACPTVPCSCSRTLQTFEAFRCGARTDPDPRCPQITCGICFPKEASGADLRPSEWPLSPGSYGIASPTESCMPDGTCRSNWNISRWTPGPNVRNCDQDCGDQCGLVVFNDCGSRVCECPFLFPRDRLSARNSTATCVQGRCSAQCIPDNCTTLNVQTKCGTYLDGCGGTFTCSPCAVTDVCLDRDKCVPNQCFQNLGVCGKNGTCIADPVGAAVCANGTFVSGNLTLGYFNRTDRTCTTQDNVLRPLTGVPCVGPPGKYTARWTGFLTAPTTGTAPIDVKFTLVNPYPLLATLKLQIGGLWVGNTTGGLVTGTVSMRRGWQHPITLELVYNTTESFASPLLEWSYPGQTNIAIPPAYMSVVRDPPTPVVTCKTPEQACAARKWPNCGPVTDGCGNNITCPTAPCRASETCGANNKCVCVPRTCWDWAWQELITPTAQACQGCPPATSLNEFWIDMDNFRCQPYVENGCNYDYYLTCGLGFSDWSTIEPKLNAGLRITEVVQDCVGETAAVVNSSARSSYNISHAYGGRATSTCQQDCGDRCGWTYFNGCGSRMCSCPPSFTCRDGRCQANSTAIEVIPGSGSMLWNRPASTNLTSHTISLWLNLNQPTGWVSARDQYIVYNGYTNTDGFGLILRKPYPRKIGIQYGGMSYSFTCAYDLPINTWMFVSAVQSTPSTWKIYVNAEWKCDITTNVTFARPTQTFTLMRKAELPLSPSRGNLDGSIDGVQVWTKIRSAAELATDMLPGALTGTESGLVFYNNFEGSYLPSGTSASMGAPQTLGTFRFVTRTQKPWVTPLVSDWVVENRKRSAFIEPENFWYKRNALPANPDKPECSFQLAHFSDLEYVRINPSQYIDALSSPGHFTAAIWVRIAADGLDDYSRVLIAKPHPTDNLAQPGWRLTVQRRSEQEYLWGSPTVAFTGLTTLRPLDFLVAAFAADEWFHVVATFDGVTQALWMNGQKVASSSNSPPAEFSSVGGPLLLGREDADSSEGRYLLDALMGEVALWTRALEDAEIRLVYDGRLAEVSQRKRLGLGYLQSDGLVSVVHQDGSTTALQVSCTAVQGYVPSHAEHCESG